jgi:hypothetical protein
MCTFASILNIAAVVVSTCTSQQASNNKFTHPPGHGVAILTVVRRDLNTALATDDDEKIIGQFSLLAQHIIFHVSFIHRLSQNGGDCLFLNIEQSTHNKQQEKKLHNTQQNANEYAWVFFQTWIEQNVTFSQWSQINPPFGTREYWQRWALWTTLWFDELSIERPISIASTFVVSVGFFFVRPPMQLHFW